MCNEYFCKKDNNRNKSCPITYIKPTDNSTLQNFLFSEGYLTYENYDGEHHGYISAPITDIIIARNGMCDNYQSMSVSSYPLFNIDYFNLNTLYRTFDYVDFSKILKINNLWDNVSYNLPFVLKFIESEKWQSQSKSAFDSDALY